MRNYIHSNPIAITFLVLAWRYNSNNNNKMIMVRVMAYTNSNKNKFESLNTAKTSPAGSRSRGGDVAVFVFDINQPSLPTPFYSVLVSISVFMALSTVFHSISSSDNFFAFSLCSSGLISALLALSTIYLFMKVSLGPDVILCG